VTEDFDMMDVTSEKTEAPSRMSRKYPSHESVLEKANKQGEANKMVEAENAHHLAQRKPTTRGKPIDSKKVSAK
jgi:hypothetical protein